VVSVRAARRATATISLTRIEKQTKKYRRGIPAPGGFWLMI
jgi:hypothetical protein